MTLTLEHQKMLVNENRLNLSDKKARNYLAQSENALRVAHHRLYFDIRLEYPATQVPAGRP